MNERDVDLMQVEVEEYLKELLEEMTREWAGDRDGKLYVQEGRQPISDSEEARDQLRLADIG